MGYIDRDNQSRYNPSRAESIAVEVQKSVLASQAPYEPSETPSFYGLVRDILERNFDPNKREPMSFEEATSQAKEIFTQQGFKLPLNIQDNNH